MSAGTSHPSRPVDPRRSADWDSGYAAAQRKVTRLEETLDSIFEAAKHPSDNALFNTVKHIEKEMTPWTELG